jgi:hypothetical protein
MFAGSAEVELFPCGIYMASTNMGVPRGILGGNQRLVLVGQREPLPVVSFVDVNLGVDYLVLSKS